MRPPRIVIRPIDKIIPNLPIPIQRPNTMPIPPHTLTSKQPCRALVLITHGQRVIEPVLQVRVPEERTIDVDVDIAKTSGVHDTTDIVGLVLENDSASIADGLMAAVVESGFDGA